MLKTLNNDNFDAELGQASHVYAVRFGRSFTLCKQAD